MAEQDDTQPTAEEQAAAEAAAQADFEAGFRGDDTQEAPEPEAKADPGDEDDGKDDTDEVNAVADAGDSGDGGGDGKSATAATTVPGSAPAPSRDDAYIAKLEGRIRTMEGRFGALNGEVKKQLSEAAARSAAAQGAAAPTAAQQRAAATSDKAANELREEFPEFFAALDSSIDGLSKRIPDRDELTRDIAAQVRTQIAEETVEDSHPGWTDIITTDEFGDWLAKQDEATRALAASPKPSAAIRLLDAYKARGDDAAMQQEATEAPAGRNQRRLQDATPATRGGGATSRSKAPTDHELFLQGFKEVR